MKIILNQDVSNLGEEGDVKVVTDGYARNFLIPKSLAVPFSKANVTMFEQKKAVIERRKEEKRKGALGLKQRISGEVITLKMPVGENGRLFGAVTNATIVEELTKIGLTIERRKVDIPDHTIKVVGTSTVKIKLYGSETADLKVIVEPLEDAPKRAEEKVVAFEKTADDYDDFEEEEADEFYEEVIAPDEKKKEESDKEVEAEDEPETEDEPEAETE